MSPPSFRQDESQPDTFDDVYGVTRNTHLQFLASTVVYVMMGFLIQSFILEGEPGFVDLPTTTYQVLFALLFVGSLVCGYLVLRMLPRRATDHNFLKSPEVSSLVDLGEQLQQQHLIRVGVSEAVAIFGVLLFLLNGSLLPLFVFVGIALALLLVIYPRREQWEAIREQAERTGSTTAG